MTDPVTNNEELGVEDQVLDATGDDADGAMPDAPGDEDTPAGDGGATAGGESATSGAVDGVDATLEPQAVPAAESAADDDSELETLRDEYERLNDRHLRLVAEFNNFRRRSEQERLGAWSRAQADLIGKFLDVLDDLQRVAELDLGNATVEAIMEGIDLVEKKFVRVLGEADIEMLDPTGESFDPEIMEAMMRVPAESEEQVDTVAQVFQKGYSLKGILVRPARVSVYTQG